VRIYGDGYDIFHGVTALGNSMLKCALVMISKTRPCALQNAMSAMHDNCERECECDCAFVMVEG